MTPEPTAIATPAWTALGSPALSPAKVKPASGPHALSAMADPGHEQQRHERQGEQAGDLGLPPTRERAKNGTMRHTPAFRVRVHGHVAKLHVHHHATAGKCIPWQIRSAKPK